MKREKEIISKSKEDKKNYSGRIFDDTFRTLCEKNPKLLIPLINEIFSTNYDMNEKFVLLSNEYHFSVMQNSDKITRNCFRLMFEN